MKPSIFMISRRFFIIVILFAHPTCLLFAYTVDFVVGICIGKENLFSLVSLFTLISLFNCGLKALALCMKFYGKSIYRRFVCNGSPHSAHEESPVYSSFYLFFGKFISCCGVFKEALQIF